MKIKELYLYLEFSKGDKIVEVLVCNVVGKLGSMVRIFVVFGLWQYQCLQVNVQDFFLNRVQVNLGIVRKETQLERYFKILFFRVLELREGFVWQLLICFFELGKGRRCQVIDIFVLRGWRIGGLRIQCEEGVVVFRDIKVFIEIFLFSSVCWLLFIVNLVSLKYIQIFQ